MLTLRAFALAVVVTFFAHVCLATSALAADQPMRIVVPAAAGGPTDTLARLVARHLSEDWRRPVIVENKPGAGGTIGSLQVARAPADGDTLLIAALSHAVNPAMMSKVPYDAMRDFTPIVKLVNFGSVLLVNSDFPARDLNQFVAYAKANPKGILWGLGALGTSQQLAGVLLSRQAGIDIVQIPYKGSGPAMVDLLANQVNFVIDGVVTAGQHVRSGKVRAIAFTGSQRSPVLPDVPTVAEQGFAGFNVETWFALLGPAGVPQDVVQEIHARVERISAQPAFRQRLVDLGATIDIRNPAATGQFIQSEIDRWTPVVKEAGIRND